MISYPDDYNPLVEYWNWIKKHPDKVSQKVKIQVKKLVKDITKKGSKVHPFIILTDFF